METYIALLRGINVSGQKKIKMAELRSHLAELNYKELKTYIQSGNVVFQTDILPAPELEQQIGNKIKEKYDFEVPVLVKSASEMQDIFNRNPFLPAKIDELNYLLVTMLSDQPEKSDVEQLISYADFGEELRYEGKELYLYFPNGYGRSKLSNNFVERKLKVKATTRNWKTIRKLTEMCAE